MKTISRIVATSALLLSGGSVAAQDATLVPSLERLAKSDNAEAIYHLGMSYHMGLGVSEDHSKALDAFRKATTLGDPLAAYKLGCYYDGQGQGLVSPDRKLALKYKLIAAEAGYALAQHDVGVLYLRNGDAPAGMAWLQKSAAQGLPFALRTLSSLYGGSAGVAPDAAKRAAYARLFFERLQPTAAQTEAISHLQKSLSPADGKRADEIVRSYKPAPSSLTVKARSGQRAATALVQSMPRN